MTWRSCTMHESCGLYYVRHTFYHEMLRRAGFSWWGPGASPSDRKISEGPRPNAKGVSWVAEGAEGVGSGEAASPEIFLTL